ncbi:MAG TPA: hypothetical protein VGN07_06435 [Steroidobacteraceae bacterium]|jgi:hypothetical protein
MNTLTLTALICFAASSVASAAQPPAAANKPLSATAGPAVNTGDAKDPVPSRSEPITAMPKASVTEPAAAASSVAAKANTAPDAAKANVTKTANAKTAKSNDRLDLDTTVVTGNRELPKVLYIVPWKRADIGDLPAQPFNTLLDEVLTPVDRDVFRREVTYYGAISSSAAQPVNAQDSGSAAPGAQPPGSEK